MKIKQNGSSGLQVVDTDRLSDISALILEKTEELLTLCRSSGKQCFLIVESGANSSPDTFVNLKNDIKAEKASEKEYLKLMNFLSHSIYYLSKGNFCIKPSNP